MIAIRPLNHTHCNWNFLQLFAKELSDSTSHWNLYSVPSRVWTVPSLSAWKFWKIRDDFDPEFFKIFMQTGTELSTLSMGLIATSRTCYRFFVVDLCNYQSVLYDSTRVCWVSNGQTTSVNRRGKSVRKFRARIPGFLEPLPEPYRLRRRRLNSIPPPPFSHCCALDKSIW